MDILSNLPDSINITVSKKDLVDLFNICIQKSRNENVRFMPEHLTIKQCAEYINYSEPAIYKMVANSEIPCYKIAGKLLFRKSEIENWLNDFKQPSLKEKLDDLRSKAK